MTGEPRAENQIATSSTKRDPLRHTPAAMMDGRGDEIVAMTGLTGERRLQSAHWKRARLALACSVSSFFLLAAASVAALTVHQLLQNLPAQQSEPLSVPDMIRQLPNTDEKPRAHLTAKITSFDYVDGEYLALQWEDRNGLAFTKGELNYQNKALIIPKKGEYFVYSQVSFRGTGTRSNKCEHITHIVTKLTSSYPEPTQLLSSTKSICEEQNRWLVPIYLGAIFQLDEGDRLVVNVSSVTQVDFTNEHKTFFGTFLL
ncbi:tumor necrosis factor ligand superfamily member 15-like [Heptranchias perlo]|uniref:tumor necrosis factor ligand superfamily member 15-like n=1 Tax=Heptranchias perlo TaxID=212740 RepID=UPI00355AB11A